MLGNQNHRDLYAVGLLALLLTGTKTTQATGGLFKAVQPLCKRSQLMTVVQLLLVASLDTALGIKTPLN